jgi:hypothetical protein
VAADPLAARERAAAAAARQGFAVVLGRMIDAPGGPDWGVQVEWFCEDEPAVALEDRSELDQGWIECRVGERAKRGARAEPGDGAQPLAIGCRFLGWPCGEKPLTVRSIHVVPGTIARPPALQDLVLDWAGPTQLTLVVEGEEGRPVGGALIEADGQTLHADFQGRASISLCRAGVEVEVGAWGYRPESFTTDGGPRRVTLRRGLPVQLVRAADTIPPPGWTFGVQVSRRGKPVSPGVLWFDGWTLEMRLPEPGTYDLTWGITRRPGGGGALLVHAEADPLAIAVREATWVQVFDVGLAAEEVAELDRRYAGR